MRTKSVGNSCHGNFHQLQVDVFLKGSMFSFYYLNLYFVVKKMFGFLLPFVFQLEAETFNFV